MSAVHAAVLVGLVRLWHAHIGDRTRARSPRTGRDHRARSPRTGRDHQGRDRRRPRSPHTTDSYCYDILHAQFYIFGNKNLFLSVFYTNIISLSHSSEYIIIYFGYKL